MLKAAIEKILSLDVPHIEEIEGKNLCRQRYDTDRQGTQSNQYHNE